MSWKDKRVLARAAMIRAKEKQEDRKKAKRILEIQLHKLSKTHHQIGFVYIALSSQCNTFKIGWSRDPERRFKDLQGANAGPIDLIGSWVAHKGMESALHGILEDYHHHSEWFTFNKDAWMDLMSFLESVERMTLALAGGLDPKSYKIALIEEHLEAMEK